MVLSGNWLSPLRGLLVTVAAAGVLCSALLFATSFFNPRAIAHSARSFVIEETKERYSEYRSQVLRNSSAEKTLGFLKQRFEVKLQDLPQTVKRLEMLVGVLMDGFCQSRRCEGIWADADQRRQIFAERQALEANDLSQGLVVIDGFLKHKTQEVLAGLIRDVRIFSGTNLAIYGALCLLVTLVGADVLRPLMVPAFLVLGSNLIATGLYLFDQNWFYTILYSHYWGYGYLILVGLILVLMLDIVVNRARGLRFLGHILGAIGSVFVALVPT